MFFVQLANCCRSCGDKIIHKEPEADFGAHPMFSEQDMQLSDGHVSGDHEFCPSHLLHLRLGVLFNDHLTE